MADPTYDEFYATVRANLPGAPDASIRSSYEQHFGTAVRTQGPSLDEFTKTVRANLPDATDDQINSTYHREFGTGFWSGAKRALLSGVGRLGEYGSAVSGTFGKAVYGDAGEQGPEKIFTASRRLGELNAPSVEQQQPGFAKLGTGAFWGSVLGGVAPGLAQMFTEPGLHASDVYGQTGSLGKAAAIGGLDAAFAAAPLGGTVGRLGRGALFAAVPPIQRSAEAAVLGQPVGPAFTEGLTEAPAGFAMGALFPSGKENPRLQTVRPGAEADFLKTLDQNAQIPSGAPPEPVPAQPAPVPATPEPVPVPMPRPEPAPPVAPPVAPEPVVQTQRPAYLKPIEDMTLATNLTPEHAAIQDEFAARVRADPEGMMAAYAQLPESEGGKILNTDVMRELDPSYLEDRSRSAAVHEPASAVIKSLYLRDLEQAPRPGEKPNVLMLAGGTGAAKTTGLKGLAAEDKARAQIIYDSNMDKVPGTINKIDLALAHGKTVTYLYTYRHPIDALENGALSRATSQEAEHGTGRTVPIEDHIRTHIGSSETVRAIREHYRGDTRVDFKFIDNSRGKGKAAWRPLETLPLLQGKEYNQLREQAYQTTQAAYRRGAISARTYTGFTGRVPPELGKAGPGLPGQLEPKRLEGPPRQEVARGPPAGEATTLTTPTGRRVTVQPKWVELADLKASDHPDYPPALQPRDRDRSGSERQVEHMARTAMPEKTRIVTNAQGEVVSGNGRTLAQRRMDEAYPEQAKLYDQWARAHGAPADMKRPILVHELPSALPHADQVDIAHEMNTDTRLARSSSETALQDAAKLDARMLSLLHEGDITSAANSDFVRAFLGKLSVTERASLEDAHGNLSADGIRRIQNAVMARAYGGSTRAKGVLQRAMESSDNEVRAVTGAMLDAAPAIADLRQAISEGKVPRPYDITPQIAQAVEDLVKIRQGGRSLEEALGQRDAFNPMDPVTERLLRLFYQPNMKRPASRQAVAEGLREYADQAERQRAGGDLVSAEPASPTEILDSILERRGGTGGGGVPPAHPDMFGVQAPVIARGPDAGKVPYREQPQTDTPEFKAWFGDSKVVDKRGRPLVVYHGTGSDFKAFKMVPHSHTDGGGSLRNKALTAFFFTNKPDVAGGFAHGAPYQHGAGENIVPVYVSLKNPVVVPMHGTPWHRAEALLHQTAEEFLQGTTKHDGMILKGVHDTMYGGPRSDVYVAFDNRQIKSAVGNRGTFDPKRPGLVETRAYAGKQVKSSDGQLALDFGAFETRPTADTGKAVDLGVGAVGTLLSRRDLRAGANVVADRITQDFTQTGNTALVGQTIRTAADLATIAQVYRDARFETLRFVYVDRAGQVIAHQGVTTRMPSAVRFDPEKLSRVLRQPLPPGAKGYWVLHNHPDGRSMPSDPDIQFTEWMQKNVHGLRGHVVLDHDEYSVIAPNGTPATFKANLGGYNPKINPRVPHPIMGEQFLSGVGALNATAVVRLAKQLQEREGFATLIGVGADGKVGSVVEYPVKLLGADQKARALARIRRMQRESGTDIQLYSLSSEADFQEIKWLHDGHFITDSIVRTHGTDSLAGGGARAGAAHMRPMREFYGQRGTLTSIGETIEVGGQKEKIQDVTPGTDNEIGGGIYRLRQFSNLEPHELATLSGVVGHLDGAVAGQRRGTVTWDATEQAALKMIQQKYGVTLDSLVNRRPGSAANATQLEAYAQILSAATKRVAALAQEVAATGSHDAKLALMAAKDKLGLMLAPALGYQTEAGRSLNILKKAAAENKRAAAIMDQLAEGSDESIQAFAKAVGKAGNLDQVLGVTRAAYTPSLWDKLYEGWISGLLSGPTTHAVNSVSNAMFQALEFGAEALAAPFSKDIHFRDLAQRAAGMAHGTVVGLKNMRDAWNTEEPVIGAQSQSQHHGKAISGLKGRIIRAPLRALLAEDEFFKAIAYHGEISSLAMREAMAKGGDVRAHFNEIMGDVMNRPELRNEARKMAERATFQTKLGPAGQALMNLANRHKFLKLIVPFIRTPSNILKTAVEYTPAAPALSAVREAISGGGKNAALGYSRMAIGSGIMLGMVALAAKGLVTGNGPADPNERALLMREGWQPYSIKVGDKWVKYNRIDPVGTLMGVAADMHDIAGASSQEDLSKVGAAVMTSIALNLGDKTFLRGITDFSQAYSDPQQYFQRWAQGMASSVVPNLAAQLARGGDPFMRQSSTMLDAMRAKIPGLRQQLAQKLDIAGEPVPQQGDFPGNPFQSQKQRPDALADTLLRLSVNRGKPATKLEFQGRATPLSDQEYQDYSGAVQKARWTVLTPLVSSPQFRAAEQRSPELAAKLLNQAWDSIGDAARMRWIFTHPEVANRLGSPKAPPRGSQYAEQASAP